VQQETQSGQLTRLMRPYYTWDITQFKSLSCRVEIDTLRHHVEEYSAEGPSRLLELKGSPDLTLTYTPADGVSVTGTRPSSSIREGLAKEESREAAALVGELDSGVETFTTLALCTLEGVLHEYPFELTDQPLTIREEADSWTSILDVNKETLTETYWGDTRLLTWKHPDFEQSSTTLHTKTDGRYMISSMDITIQTKGQMYKSELKIEHQKVGPLYLPSIIREHLKIVEPDTGTGGTQTISLKDCVVK
jgi:hypothetical protein